jgi:Ni,Fe-hydrogenase maturation factor
MKTVYVFGNPLVKEDSLPMKLVTRLRKKFSSIDFREFDTTEDLEERDLVIIDTVKGIGKVEIIEDIDKIVADKIYSMHDFDLGQNLRLMKKMKMIDRVRILGVPFGMGEEDAFEHLKVNIEFLRVVEDFEGLPRFPDNRIDYTNSNSAPTVNVFVAFKGKLLMAKRSADLKNYPSKWSNITGFLDEIKSVGTKALEEMKEELGVGERDVSSMFFGDVLNFKDKKKTWIIFPVLVMLKREPKIRLDYENQEYKWTRPNDMAKLDIVPMLGKVYDKLKSFMP